jgi:hypothetical protein
MTPQRSNYQQNLYLQTQTADIQSFILGADEEIIGDYDLRHVESFLSHRKMRAFITNHKIILVTNGIPREINYHEISKCILKESHTFETLALFRAYRNIEIHLLTGEFMKFYCVLDTPRVKAAPINEYTEECFMVISTFLR